MDEMTEGTRNATTQSKPPVALVLTLLLIFTVSLTAVLLWGLPQEADSEQANMESPDLAAPVQQSQAVPKQPEKPLAPEDILGNSVGKEEIVQLKIPAATRLKQTSEILAALPQPVAGHLAATRQQHCTPVCRWYP